MTDKGDNKKPVADWLARGGAVAAFLGSTWIGACVQRTEAIRSAQWEAKRDACVEALDVIDAYFTTLKWSTDGKERPVQGVQKVNIQRIRRVFNRLAVSVTAPDVLILYGKAFHVETVPGKGVAPMSLGILADLRNAIRRELFEAPPINQTDLAWIFNIYTACSGEDPDCPIDK